jgi:hypothetical protein
MKQAERRGLVFVAGAELLVDSAEAEVCARRHFDPYRSEE